MPFASLEIALASIGNATLKNYDVALKKWWIFCNSRAIDLFKPDIQQILSFLTEEFEKGLSYSSINCTRSAIALIIDFEIAEDHRMKRFFKGISNLRPSRPKYDYTWDPKIVLDYFSQQPSNDNLKIGDLLKKLITLFALTTGHRMQTFSLISIDNIRILNDKIEIKIPARIKTSKRNSMQPFLILPFYSDEKLCVASALRRYLDLSKNIRTTIKNLFIFVKKPIRNVSTQTLSHWVKDILNSSKIDTTVFSAHSVRHASTSAAKRLGVDIELIRKTAGWSKHSETFAKFYDTNVVTDRRQFALSILES